MLPRELLEKLIGYSLFITLQERSTRNAGQNQVFVQREELQRNRAELDDLVEVAWSRGAEKGLQLRKHQSDGIEVPV